MSRIIIEGKIVDSVKGVERSQVLMKTMPMPDIHDPETWHDLVVAAGRHLPRSVTSFLRNVLQVHDPIHLAGIDFPNRIGLAAGFDKQGVFVHAAAALGFGHIEVGSVTPEPQPGNPRPRIEKGPNYSIRNWMGFPSPGRVAVKRHLEASQPYPIPVGVSLGKNLSTPPHDAEKDYLKVLDTCHRFADYIVVNLSSPNTPGLRDLDQVAIARKVMAASGLLDRVGPWVYGHDRRASKPVFLKLSPDLDYADLHKIMEAWAMRGHQSVGLVISNTTTDHQFDKGGISGSPLFPKALNMVKLAREIERTIPIIGVGGICGAEDARRMLDAGADMVQVLTGFVFGGPLFPRMIASGMRGYRVQRMGIKL